MDNLNCAMPFACCTSRNIDCFSWTIIAFEATQEAWKLIEVPAGALRDQGGVALERTSGKMRYVPMPPKLAVEIRRYPAVIGEDRILPARAGCKERTAASGRKL
jgi:hypothetical protein